MHKVKMTSLILMLVVGSIISSIAAVSASIYYDMHAAALTAGMDQQSANLGMAVTILERSMAGSRMSWTAEGSVDAFRTWSIPQFKTLTRSTPSHGSQNKT